MIERTDGKHLWINIFFLLFVSLIPFSTSLTGDYPREPLAEVFFDSNIFILGMLLTWNWHYATSHHRLVERSLDPRLVVLGKRRAAVTMPVAALAMGLAFLDPQISFFAYLLLPILQGVFTYHPRRQQVTPYRESVS